MAWKRCVIVFVTILLPLVISYRNLTKTENGFEAGDRNGFKKGDRIPLFVNTVESLHYDNRSEYTQPYFELPFCPPGDPIFNRKKTLQEILDGDCYTPTQYELKFKVGTIRKILCEKNLTKDEVSKFRYAAIHKFKYNMYFNSIKFTGIVGIVRESGKVYLVKHIDFYPHYYENQVKEINSASDFDSAVDITDDAEIKVNFTYSVFWKDLNISLENSAFWKEISTKSDWRPPAEPEVWIIIILYLIPSAVIIYIWLWLLLAILDPYLRSYFTRCSQGNALDTLRKIISQKIPDNSCRRPPYSSLLGAILGVGIQHLIVICSLLLMPYIDVLYPWKPESEYMKLLLLNCLSSGVSGYRATSFHARYSAHGWKECVFQTGALYIVPVFWTALVINTVKIIFYDQSDLPKFGTVVELFIICGLGTVFFLTLGGSFGYYYTFEYQEHSATSRSKSLKRIPQQYWWMSTPAQMFLGGLLPFMTIFWDMDEIYASLWNLKVCGALSSLFKAFLMVIIMTIFVAMSCTYHKMTKKDPHWWWRYYLQCCSFIMFVIALFMSDFAPCTMISTSRNYWLPCPVQLFLSVLRGGSTAIFMFAYGIYYYPRAGTKDIIKLLIFLGYNACIFYSFFLVLGTIGFFASSTIAHRMYARQDKRK